MEKRNKRVNVDKNVEVLIVNNSNKRIIFDSPRMQTPIDLEQKGDQEFITVSDLRTMVNANRKMFESFTLIVVDIIHDDYTLEDLFRFVGLDKSYNEYYSLRPNSKDKSINTNDIENFILKSNGKRFEDILKNSSVELHNKIVQESVILFKEGKLNDYNKMNTIKVAVGNDDLFLDAEETNKQ